MNQAYIATENQLPLDKDAVESDPIWRQAHLTKLEVEDFEQPRRKDVRNRLETLADDKQLVLDVGTIKESLKSRPHIIYAVIVGLAAAHQERNEKLILLGCNPTLAFQVEGCPAVSKLVRLADSKDDVAQLLHSQAALKKLN